MRVVTGRGLLSGLKMMIKEYQTSDFHIMLCSTHYHLEHWPPNKDTCLCSFLDGRERRSKRTTMAAWMICLKRTTIVPVVFISFGGGDLVWSVARKFWSFSKLLCSTHLTMNKFLAQMKEHVKSEHCQKSINCIDKAGSYVEPSSYSLLRVL